MIKRKHTKKKIFTFFLCAAMLITQTAPNFAVEAENKSEALPAIQQISEGAGDLPGDVEGGADGLPGDVEGGADDLPGDFESNPESEGAGGADGLPGDVEGDADGLPGDFESNLESEGAGGAGDLPGDVEGDAGEAETMALTAGRPRALDGGFEALLEKNKIETTTPINTKVNLFDYWVYGEQTTNDWIEQAKLNPSYSSHTAGINQAHPLIVGNGMDKYGSQDYYYGLWNTTATSWNWWDCQSNCSWLEGIVANRLGEDGMPQLNKQGAKNSKNISQKVYDAWDKNLSLDYFFDPKKEVQGRKVYEDVRGLFTLESGNYYFNSSKNYAQFIEDNSRVTGSDGYFNVYNTWAIKNGNHAGGNFAPFNTAQQLLMEDLQNPGKLKDKGIGRTQNQTIGKLNNSTGKLNKEATSAGTTPEDTSVNHYLGLTMETSFIQPEDGRIKGGKNDKGDPMVDPMAFVFTGDNDVWIYIDDVLVGDLGGLHSESCILIDFSKGYVYRGPVHKDGTPLTLKELEEMFSKKEPTEKEIIITHTDEKNKKYFFSRTTLRAMHEAAGDDTQTWDETNPFTYADDTIHTFQFFYLERGGYDTNLTLEFNLVSVPHSGILKVDQDNDPVVGAGFELYAADYDETTKETTIKKDYNEGKPICTAFTDEKGWMMLVDDHRRIVQFDELAEKQGITSYILRESEVPVGYRSRGDVFLYYENGIVFARDYLKSGAYTSAILNVTLSDKLRDLESQNEVVSNTAVMKGIIFAVPLKVDEKRKFDEKDPEAFHPILGSVQTGWRVMAEGADLTKDKSALIKAAKSYNAVAEKNSRNVYSMVLDNIPGAAKHQYWYAYTDGKSQGLTETALEDYVKENTEYMVAFYYAPEVTSIKELTADSTVYRLDDSEFEKEFTSQLHIPNAFNRFRVQKMDYRGNWVEGATFGLYQLYAKHDHDGEKDGYLPVHVYQKEYYINTLMFDLTEEDLAMIKQGKESGNLIEVTTQGSGGDPIHKKMKSYEKIKKDWDKGEGNREIPIWDENITKGQSSIGKLNLNGTAMFPSAYEDEIHNKNVKIKEEDTSTYLEVGYYVMCELSAPENHVVNETLVPVEVTDENIYANAGSMGDGVRVGMYVGFPQGTMSPFAQEDAIDATLTYLKVQLKKNIS